MLRSHHEMRFHEFLLCHTFPTISFCLAICLIWRELIYHGLKSQTVSQINLSSSELCQVFCHSNKWLTQQIELNI
jgi:hypothetical protein